MHLQSIFSYLSILVGQMVAMRKVSREADRGELMVRSVGEQVDLRRRQCPTDRALATVIHHVDIESATIVTADRLKLEMGEDKLKNIIIIRRLLYGNG